MNYKIEAKDNNVIDNENIEQIDSLEQEKEINKKQFIALCLHKVDYSNNEFSITPEVFDNIIKELKHDGYTFVDISDLRDIYYGKSSMPEKAVFLGFDDGYEDNYTYAFPVLKKEQVKATFFIVSSKLDAPGRLTVKEIKEMLANGFKIGSHTVSHDDLTNLTKEQIDKEFKESQQVLSDTFNTPIYSLAYPCGFKNGEVVDLARQYYDIAFTASVDSDQKETPFTIQRYGVFKWNKTLSSIMHNKQHEV